MTASRPVPGAIALGCVLMLSACSGLHAPQSAATTAEAATAVTPSSGATPPSGSPPANAPNVASNLPAFDAVTRGAEREAGLMPVWRRADKVWLELPAELLSKPLFLSPQLTTGIGEAGVFGGLMQSRFAQVGRPQWVEFRKVNQQIQLVAVNAAYAAEAGTPQAHAVKAAYSPSLLASAPLVSAAHPKSGAVLVEAAPLLLGDWLGLAQHLQRNYRQSYALDRQNSALQQTQSLPSGGMAFEVLQHFATGGIAAPGPIAPGTPPSSVPLAVPDPRSLFVTLRLSLSPLPASAMARHPADPRVGYFSTTVTDFSQEGPRTPRQRFINRWRLDKLQPDAALSEPVAPIVYALDASIPAPYRDTIRDAVLSWNSAFEAIGFKNAIVVKDAPAEATSPRTVQIRWMTNSQPAFGAIGPVHVDPRSGEILGAQIALESLSSRAIRTARSQILSGTPAAEHVCDHAEQAHEQLDLGLQWLALQAGPDGAPLDPDAPEVQAFVLAYLRDTTMHEVGHTLGLRHNFRASRWRTQSELQDLALTQAHGNSASVMDYAPINLPAPGQQGGAPFQTTLGPYDIWAIAYGYTPLPPDAPGATAQLKQIAERANQADQADALAYGTDEDQGSDPEVQTFDLGKDPIAFAHTRMAIVRNLLAQQARWVQRPMADPSLPRRTVAYGVRELARTAQVLMRQLGGVVARRTAAYVGADSLQPVAGSVQRAALDTLISQYLRPDAFDMPAALQRRLGPDWQERGDAGDGQFAGIDFSWSDQLLALQRPVLDVLSSEALADRLMDNLDKAPGLDAAPLTPVAVQQQLFDAIWRGPELPAPLQAARHNLQREHANRLAVAVVRPGSNRADVRALMRQQAERVLKLLQTQVGARAAQKPGGTDALAQAHRLDCIQTLSSALQAGVVRSSP